MTQSVDRQKFFLEEGKVGVILKHEAPVDPEYCTLSGLDDLEQFALKHMDESPELFQDLALMLQQAAAHQMILETI